MEMVNTGHLVGPGRRPQSRILRCLYLLKARVTCVGAPDWCCIVCDRFPQINREVSRSYGAKQAFSLQASLCRNLVVFRGKFKSLLQHDFPGLKPDRSLNQCR